MALSARRQRFVNAYLGEAGGNAAEAARLAGYSVHTARQAGSRTLTFPDVQEAIAKAVTVTKFTVDQAIDQLAILAETPTAKVTSGDKLKAIELFLKAKGALRDNTGESRVTVNIGFLGASQPTLAIKHVMGQVMGRGATVALLAAEADPVEP